MKFAEDKCSQCGANLARRKQVNVIEVKPHPGEEGLVEERSFAPCPSCGVGITVVELSEPATTGPGEDTEPVTDPPTEPPTDPPE